MGGETAPQLHFIEILKKQKFVALTLFPYLVSFYFLAPFVSFRTEGITLEPYSDHEKNRIILYVNVFFRSY